MQIIYRIPIQDPSSWSCIKKGHRTPENNPKHSVVETGSSSYCAASEQSCFDDRHEQSCDQNHEVNKLKTNNRLRL